MSLIALGLNVLLVGLLLAALTVGLRLNKRLKALKDSQDGFAGAVRELNLAAARAEQGLADLRAATDEATDALAERIEKGRALAAKLDTLLESAPARAAAVAPDADAVQRRFGALLSAAREVRASPSPIQPPRREPQAAPLRQAAAQPDDDLFEESPTLRRLMGVRR